MPEYDDLPPTASRWRLVLLLLVLLIAAALLVFVVLPQLDLLLNPPRDLPLQPPVRT